MMDDHLMSGLKRGDASSLRQFYDLLTSSEDDEQFWETLQRLVRTGTQLAGVAELSSLRREVRTASYQTFLERSPRGIVLSFLMVAMLFSGCTSQPASESNRAVVDDRPMMEYSQADEMRPSVGGSMMQVAPITETGAREEDAPPSSEQIRSRLLEYISRAELPAREKREMQRVVRVSRDSEIIDTQGDLEKLLRTDDPKRIARILEATALLKSVAKKDSWKPSMGAKYKAVSMDWDEA